MVYECDVCGWHYDENKGCKEKEVSPGTKWDEVPEDFRCPLCGSKKNHFTKETGS